MAGGTPTPADARLTNLVTNLPPPGPQADGLPAPLPVDGEGEGAVAARSQGGDRGRLEPEVRVPHQPAPVGVDRRHRQRRRPGARAGDRGPCRHRPPLDRHGQDAGSGESLHRRRHVRDGRGVADERDRPDDADREHGHRQAPRPRARAHRALHARLRCAHARCGHGDPELHEPLPGSRGGHGRRPPAERAPRGPHLGGRNRGAQPGSRAAARGCRSHPARHGGVLERDDARDRRRPRRARRARVELRPRAARRHGRRQRAVAGARRARVRARLRPGRRVRRRQGCDRRGRCGWHHRHRQGDRLARRP